MPFVRCVKCQYWAKIGTSMRGLCRRKAPAVESLFSKMAEHVDERNYPIWPNLHADEGCGDGKELPEVLQDSGLYGTAVNLQELYRNKKADQES